MLKRLQHQVWFKFLSKVLALASALVVAPIALVASIPLVCFMAPVALMALPFMLVAFFGQNKEARTVQQPLRKLQPQLSH